MSDERATLATQRGATSSMYCRPWSDEGKSGENVNIVTLLPTQVGAGQQWIQTLRYFDTQSLLHSGSIACSWWKAFDGGREKEQESHGMAVETQGLITFEGLSWMRSRSLGLGVVCTRVGEG